MGFRTAREIHLNVFLFSLKKKNVQLKLLIAPFPGMTESTLFGGWRF